MSLGLSLSLECLQLIFSIGSFDVDDLILNVSGGLLGYGIFLAVIASKMNRGKTRKRLKANWQINGETSINFTEFVRSNIC